MPEPIRVVVVHDDPLICVGLIAALGAYSDIQPAASGIDCIEASGPGARFDVLVADYSHGIQLAESFARRSAARARVKIIIVTANDTEWHVRNAMAFGIGGYLLAGLPLDQLAIGVRTVHRGGRYFSPGVTQRLAESLSAEPLTGREEAVLQLVVDGLCNRAIACRLGVAVDTVKTHLKSIFEKLGVGTRTQAVLAVARRGLLGSRVPAPAERADVSASDAMRTQYAENCGAGGRRAGERYERGLTV